MIRMRRGLSSAFLGVFGALVFHAAPALAILAYGPVTGHIGNPGVAGSGPGEFSSPDGVAVDQTTADVYVVDTGNNRVEKFDSSGVFLSQLTEVPASSGASVTGPLVAPTAVAVEPLTEDVYVADSGHNVVDKFSSSGVYLSQIPGQPALSFSNPDGLAVDPTNGPTGGDLYVADRGNNLVDVFSPSGQLIGDFPEVRPWSLGVDLNGNVYVASGEEERVVEHAPLGQSIVRVFSYGRNELFGHVRSVGVDLHNNDAFLGAILGPISSGPYQLEEVNSSGELTAQPPFGGSALSNPGSTSPGIAVESTSLSTLYALYATDAANDVVDIFKLVVLPHPETGGSSNVKGATASVSGKVNPESNEVEASYFFEYGPCNENEVRLCSKSAYTSNTPEMLAGAGTSPIPTSLVTLTGLIPETTYHYRLVAKNANDEAGVAGEEASFTTAAVAFTGEATSVQPTSATLNGLLDAENTSTLSTLYRFEYASSEEYESPNNPNHEYTHFGEVGSNNEDALVPVSANIGVSEPLEPGTTYHYRLFVVSEVYGVIAGKDKTFTTLPALPAVDKKKPLGATGISLHEATLHGTVNPGRGITTYHFEYGQTTAYESGSTAPAYTPINPNLLEEDAVEQLIIGLEPGTIYHYRLVATNLSGTTPGPDETLTTLPGTPPIVETTGANELSPEAATITGTVNPAGQTTSYTFEIGTTTNYGTQIFAEPIRTAKTVTTTLAPLQPGTTYHYRLRATNAGGTSYGTDQTFTTPALPISISQPTTSALLATPPFPAITNPTPPRSCKKGYTRKNGKCTKKKKTTKSKKKHTHK